MPAILAGAVVVTVAMAFYRSTRATLRARSEALAELDGQYLAVALNRGRMVLEEEGFLRLKGRDAILDTGEREIFVAVAQICWIVDPRTGDRVAGPW